MIKHDMCHPVVGSGFALSARPGMTGVVTVLLTLYVNLS
jgi:hypothetical protein